MRKKQKHLDVTTMFIYPRANMSLAQSVRAYYLSYFINLNILLLCFIWVMNDLDEILHSTMHSLCFYFMAQTYVCWYLWGKVLNNLKFSIGKFKDLPYDIMLLYFAGMQQDHLWTLCLDFIHSLCLMVSAFLIGILFFQFLWLSCT